jgi:hypothetical protein
MNPFESAEDKALRLKIAAEEKAKFDKRQKGLKAAKIRREEKAKLESGGLIGAITKEIKKNLKGVV